MKHLKQSNRKLGDTIFTLTCSSTWQLLLEHINHVFALFFFIVPFFFFSSSSSLLLPFIFPSPFSLRLPLSFPVVFFFPFPFIFLSPFSFVPPCIQSALRSAQHFMPVLLIPPVTCCYKQLHAMLLHASCALELLFGNMKGMKVFADSLILCLQKSSKGAEADCEWLCCLSTSCHVQVGKAVRYLQPCL